MINIEKEAYETASNLFSFKEMKRSIIDYGKKCYIEGYKGGYDLLLKILVNQDYLPSESIDSIHKQFDIYLSGDIIRSLYCNVSPDDFKLSDSQSDILGIVLSDNNKKECDEYNELYIQKPRQCGVSTILKTISYLLCSKEKKVLYLGYDDVKFKNKFINFINIAHTSTNVIKNVLNNKTCGVLYDYIIVDELSFLNREIYDYIKLYQKLTNSKVIYVVTPCSGSEKYMDLLKTDTNKECKFTCTSGGVLSSYDKKLIYEIIPSDKNIKMAMKHAEIADELLGKYLINNKSKEE